MTAPSGALSPGYREGALRCRGDDLEGVRRGAPGCPRRHPQPAGQAQVAALCRHRDKTVSAARRTGAPPKREAAMSTRSSHHSVGHWLGLVALFGLILLGAFGFDRVQAQEALAIDPARFRMPNAMTAGVQAGVTLTPYTGPMNITTAGTVI